MTLKKAVGPRKTRKTRNKTMNEVIGELSSKALRLIEPFRAFCVFRGLKIRTAGSASYCDL